jgi:hypothetical protein
MSHNLFLVKARCHPSWVKNTPSHVLDASHSKTNIFLKFGTSRMGLENMESFKVRKDLSIASFHIKAFFLKRFVKQI